MEGLVEKKKKKKKKGEKEGGGGLSFWEVAASQGKTSLQSSLKAPGYFRALPVGKKGVVGVEARLASSLPPSLPTSSATHSSSSSSGAYAGIVVEQPWRKQQPHTTESAARHKWAGMTPSAMSEDAQRTLQMVANRHAIDPKRHYRKDGNKPNKLPKTFQVGTVLQGAAEFYSSRMLKSERRSNLAEEILADDRLRPYIKRKFGELQDAAAENGKAAYKKRAKKREPKWKRGAKDMKRHKR